MRDYLAYSPTCKTGYANVEECFIFLNHSIIDFILELYFLVFSFFNSFKGILAKQFLDFFIMEKLLINWAQKQNFQCDVILKQAIQMHSDIAFAALGNC